MDRETLEALALLIERGITPEQYEASYYMTYAVGEHFGNS